MENKIKWPLPAIITFGFALACSYYHFTDAVLPTVKWGILFAIIFLLISFFVDNSQFLPEKLSKFKKFELVGKILKLVALGLVIIAFVFYPLVREIPKRMNEANYNIVRVNDGIVQTEEAVKFLLDGKNPYSEKYFGTSLEKWLLAVEKNSDSPSLHHYVYLPFQLVLFAPFQAVVGSEGVFDGRIIILFAEILVLVLLFFVPRKFENKLTLLALFFLNPIFIKGYIWGHNDILMFAFLLASILLLRFNKFKSGLVFLALACGIKQIAWFAVPFIFAFYLNGDYSIRNLKCMVVKFWPFWLTVGVIFLPFVLWEPVAFYNSTIGFLAGTTQNSYYSLGDGFSGLLALPKNTSFPFWAIQLCILGVFFPWFLVVLKKRSNFEMSLGLFAIFTLLVMYFSRYFYISHAFSIVWTFLVLFFLKDEKKASDQS